MISLTPDKRESIQENFECFIFRANTLSKWNEMTSLMFYTLIIEYFATQYFTLSINIDKITKTRFFLIVETEISIEICLNNL